MSGWADVPLSSKGHAQVARLAERLRAEPPFDFLYSSPSSRAIDTARGISGGGPIHTLQQLREIHCGDMDGVPVEEVQRLIPELWAANLRQDDDTFRWPGGESYREFRARCVSAVRALVERHRGARIAVVTHSGFISQVVGSLCGASPAEWGRYRPDNTAISELAWGVNSGRVITFDDRSHLLHSEPSTSMLPLRAE